MIATDAIIENVEIALWNMISDAGVSTNVFVSNRPNATVSLDDYVIVTVNGNIKNYQGYSRCVCLVQLFVKDIDKKGTKNMTRMTEMYSDLLAAIPHVDGVYTFNNPTPVGKRDSVEFHSTLVNLDCLIY